jgi:hypothetical protein
VSIGQTFENARQIIVLVQAADGTEHAFQVEGKARWEWTGLATGETMGHGSAGRVTVEGRFHRKNRDPIMQAAFDAAATKELPRAEA